MKKTVFIFAVGFALVTTLLLLRHKVGEFNDSQHDQFQTALWQVKHLDTTFNEDLLESRFALLDSYDDFQLRATEMKQGLDVLEHPPAFITSAGREAIANACADYLAILGQREKLFERFKTHNSSIGNSRRYLPVALEELAARLNASSGTNADDFELQNALADLGRLVLNCLSSPGALPDHTESRIQQFKSWSQNHPHHPEARFALSLARHAQIILTGQTEVDGLTHQLMALPTATVIQQLFTAYQGEVTVALRRTQQYRAFLYVLGFVTLVILGGGFLALSAANQNLERRVRERTTDLEAEVSERKLAEEKLRETLQSLTTINTVLDTACIIARTDRKGNITFVNDNFCRISGYSRDELLGQNHRILKSNEHPDPFFSEMWRTIARGDIWRGEVRNSAKNGGSFWVDTTIGPMLDEHGKPKGYMAIRTDVTERKRIEAEVAEMNQRLLDASRKAGMAEVATGVLHNVGNVLNSINVSSTYVADRLRKSKLANLPRVAALLRAHEADLSRFFANDPKARQLPAYLAQLADHLTSEQTRTLAELAELQKHVDHIKDIVVMQQGFAKFSGIAERLPVGALLEDALRMNASALVRHEIQIHKEFGDDPLITVDKHKALQIFVNLLQNAKQACDEAGRDDKQITLRIMNENKRVQISITDNGVGISPENIDRIFNHGFTTKANGHGFGLHSGANAAKEMGGSLQVHSEGVGRGATFTVELPLQPPEKSHA